MNEERILLLLLERAHITEEPLPEQYQIDSFADMLLTIKPLSARVRTPGTTTAVGVAAPINVNFDGNPDVEIPSLGFCQEVIASSSAID